MERMKQTVSIPESINKQNIIEAIQYIDNYGYPNEKTAKDYVLEYNGKQYPVKFVISIGKQLSEGISIEPNTTVDTSWFKGGVRTNSFLEKLGFKIKKLSLSKEELANRKAAFLKWGSKKSGGKWTSVYPKANWLSGYCDEGSKYEKIKFIPIKNIALNIQGLTENERNAVWELPENLFSFNNLKEFQEAKEILNKIFSDHSSEVNREITSFNLLDRETDKRWRSWEYSNFKRTSWAKNYEQYLKECENGLENNIGESYNISGWNRILYGPPGTGKTYSINEVKENLINGQHSTSRTLLNYATLSWKEAIYLAFKRNNNNPMTIKQIEQSEVVKQYAKTKSSKTPYGTLSTTIIENATEKSTGTIYRKGTDLFERVDGLSEKKWILTEDGKIEADEVEDVVNTERLAEADFYFSLVTFHQSYGYEDFIEGIYAETEDGQIHYSVKDGVFKEFCNRAKEYPNKNFLFVIDEINRGNISKIFGELITLIEPCKRLGKEEGLSITLPYSGDIFGVPQNVFILGTMNTADRSIALMDTALRRRFEFIERMPDADIIRDEVGEIDGIEIADILQVMNDRIEFFYDREHTLGHAFFLNISTIKELQSVYENKIIPLLQEYFYEDYEKIQAVLNDINGIYIKRESKQSINLFDSKFANLISDYDTDRFVLKTNVSDEEFVQFIQSVVVGGE